MTWDKFSFLGPLFMIISASLVLNLAGSCENLSLMYAQVATAGLTKGIAFNDPNLRAEHIFTGLELTELHGHSPVSKMAFLGPDDLLVLDKNGGQVRRILNGTLLPDPLLDVSVANERERGLLGIAVASGDNIRNSDSNNVIAEPQNKLSSNTTYVFLYFTQSRIAEDGVDDCPPPKPYYCKGSGEPLGNRVYRYELAENSSKLINPKLLLDVPVKYGPIHNGGTLTVGPDKNLYIGTGDGLSYYSRDHLTEAMNLENGADPDGRAGILRMTQDGLPILNGSIIGDRYPLNLYYAYGIRNSFGMDFDPVTGNLWDTENGPAFGDEINLVEPGFNSGWSKVQGVWEPDNLTSSVSIIDLLPKKYEIPDQIYLSDFDGKGKYSPPEFIWTTTVAPTALKFYDSDKLGKRYENDMFVADYNGGNIYHFELSENRTGFDLGESNKLLIDKVANNTREKRSIIFGQGFGGIGGGITDLEVSPDGYLHVLARTAEGKASIYRVVGQNDIFLEN
jgi:glucose/arabinose dehydrogenase